MAFCFCPHLLSNTLHKDVVGFAGTKLGRCLGVVIWEGEAVGRGNCVKQQPNSPHVDVTKFIDT